MQQTILITGASRGLGLACAELLSKRENVNLILLGRSETTLKSAQHQCHNSGNHHIVACDLTELDQIVPALDPILQKVGCISVVLHAAGGGMKLSSELITAPDMMRLFALNVAAAAEINRLVVPAMRAKKSGRLVHIGSVAAKEALGSVGYNSVRAAQSAYVRSLGRELAPSGIIVTGVLPGSFVAPGNNFDRLAKDNPAAFQNFVAGLPSKTILDVKEIASIVQYLCESASKAFNGCMIPADGAEGRSFNVPS